MSISYPLSLPTNKSSASIVLYADNVNSVSISPFTLKQQIHEFEGEGWMIDVTLPQMNWEDAAPWVAFLTKLRGVQGTFLAGDTTHREPLGNAAGIIQVNGAQGTGGDTLNLKGFGSSVVGVLKEGDKIQVGNRLYMVLNDANSTASGLATIDIFPKLRSAVADSDGVITSSPKGLFRLKNNRQRLMASNRDRIFTLSFQAVEAIG